MQIKRLIPKYKPVIITLETEEELHEFKVGLKYGIKSMLENGEKFACKTFEELQKYLKGQN